MKRYVISLAIVIIFLGYIAYEKFHKSHPAIATTDNSSTQTSQGSDTTTLDTTNEPPTPAPMPTPTPTPTPTPVIAKGRYKNGTYTGSVEDAYYGPLQVQAVVSGGKLVDVKFLQYPSDAPHSQEVNSYSSPILRREAIAAQSADVNIVSGATQSSEAFRKSLFTALAQAS